MFEMIAWKFRKLAVIASAAKQSRSHEARLDCFVASLLAMTALSGCRAA
jgi:hypothetical protein